MSSVDQIKSKIDIVSLISSYIKLEKAGANFKGRCPFHHEKTPSFFVSPDRGNYYCFGCHAKGDIFTFVEEFEGLDFKGALKVLADRAGVSLENYSSSEKSQKDRFYQVLEKATLFFQNNLETNDEVKEYLTKRGINSQSIRDFRIGWSHPDWRNLFDYLKKEGYSEKEMLSVGLIKQKDGTFSLGNSYYDVFRGRIIFPISDSSGRVVGFSGRILKDDPKSPKYLNTPETELFNKSEILFGLDKAKNDIKIKDYSILVEGQMDAVLMHQVGLTNTVASSGTALTENHLIKLRRLSDRIMMSFDSDKAGFSASQRSSKLALSLGMDLKLVSFPEGKDPADLAKEDPEKLKECFRNSKSIVDFHIDNLLEMNLNPKDLAIEVRKNVLPYIALIKDKTDQSQWIGAIKRKTFLNEEALWEDLKKINSGEVFQNIASPPPKINRAEGIERKIIGLLFYKEALESKDNELAKILEEVEIEKKAKEVLKDRLEFLKNNLKKDKELLLFEIESYYNNKNNSKKDIEELLLSLEEENLRIKLSDAMVNLQKAEQKRESSEVLKFLEQCQNITQRINTIKTIRSAYEKK